MTIHYSDESVTIHHGDCLDILRTLPDASVDAVVTDPPYSLRFMSRDWDAHATPAEFQAWCEQWAVECLRVLKPGGHLLAFGGARTSHRLACGIEDAGFEIRDSITWLYGSGFPKSLDVSKAIDGAAGAERGALGAGPYAARRPRADHGSQGLTFADDSYIRPAGHSLTAPATDDARRWDGWGTALKPASEPIVVARKPLAAGTVAGNVLAHGTGALNIAACRVGTELVERGRAGRGAHVTGSMAGGALASSDSGVATGRWPANVVLSHGEACGERCASGCAVAELDAQSGDSASSIGQPRGAASGAGWRMTATGSEYADEGGASRFFPTFRYEAKAATSERPKAGEIGHPTVKPVPLMRWLVRLVTPPGGVVLDPFLGSGTTAEACQAEGFRCIGIEREADYLPLIVQRVTKRADPVRHLADKGDDLGLLGLLDGEAS